MTMPCLICIPHEVFEALKPDLGGFGWRLFEHGYNLARYRWNQKVMVYQRGKPDGGVDEIAIELSNVRGIKDVLIWGAATTIETELMPLVHRVWPGTPFALAWDDPSNPFRLRTAATEAFGIASGYRFACGLIRCEAFTQQGLCGPDEETLIINIHGTFGNKAGSSDKYRRLARTLVSRLAGDVLIYSSSRDWMREDARIAVGDSSYAAKMAPFIHDGVEKTFTQELADVRRVLAHAMRGRQTSKLPRILLIGHSLGGLLAFYVAKAVPGVDMIVSVGTGLRRTPMDLPILRSLPPPEDIKRVVGDFKGAYIMHQAGADDTFSPDDYDSLYAAACQAKSRTRLRHDGADHAFKTLDSHGNPWFEEIIRHLSGTLALHRAGEPRYWPPSVEP